VPARVVLASPIVGVPSSQIYQSGQAANFPKTIVKQMLDNCQEAGDGKSTPQARGGQKARAADGMPGQVK
jgi:hypothetical protein